MRVFSARRFSKIVRAVGAATIERLEPRRHLAGQLDDRLAAVAADSSEIAFDQNNALHRVWRDTATGFLFYAARDQNLHWGNVSLIEARPVGDDFSLTIDPLGRPAVAYWDNNRNDLLVARLAAGVWTPKNVDVVGDVGEHPSLAFAPSGKPFVTYYDATNQDLKLAWTTRKGKWVTHRLAEAGDVGKFSSIAIDQQNGLIRSAYADTSELSLRFATQQADGTFAIQTVDSATTGGVRWISLAIDSTRHVPGISYFDAAKGDLKFAQFGGTWATQTVASQGTQGEFSRLSYFKGAPSIVSLNRSLQTVNKATLADGKWTMRLLGWSSGQLSAAADRGGHVAFSLLSLDGKRTLTPGDTTQPLPAEDDASDRLVEWIIVGGSNTITADRRVAWGIKEHGWKYFVDNQIKPLIPLGAKRIFLHNPFGTLPNQDMQFDQYIEAQNAGLTWLTNGFVSAIKPITSAGVEVIGYLGTLVHDQQFTAIKTYDEYLSRVKRSIQPLLDAGMSIGFDYIMSARYTDWAFQVVQSLRDSGVRVYAENRPIASETYWHTHATIHYDNLYRSLDPAVNQSMSWAATNSMLKGEVLRDVGTPPTGISKAAWPAWQAQTVKAILAEGDTAMLNFRGLAQAGYTPQSMLNAARGAPAAAPASPSTPISTTRTGLAGDLGI